MTVPTPTLWALLEPLCRLQGLPPPAILPDPDTKYMSVTPELLTYRPAWVLDQMRRPAAGDRLLGALAHETYHIHLPDERGPHAELAADHHAGHLLRRLGISPEGFLGLLLEIDPYRSPIHPAFLERRAAVLRGHTEL